MSFAPLVFSKDTERPWSDSSSISFSFLIIAICCPDITWYPLRSVALYQYEFFIMSTHPYPNHEMLTLSAIEQDPIVVHEDKDTKVCKAEWLSIPEKEILSYCHSGLQNGKYATGCRSGSLTRTCTVHKHNETRCIVSCWIIQTL